MSDDDPTLTPEQRALRERERKHFVFASVLIIGCMLMLPISGAAYVLMIRAGWVSSPFPIDPPQPAPRTPWTSDGRNFVERLTGPGAAALAVVRLRGPGVGAFLAKRFSRPVVRLKPTHGHLRDDAGILDDPVVVLNDRGDEVDLTFHGSGWIVESVCALAVAEGFADVTPALPADVPGEVDAALPRVRTERAARTLLAQPDAWARLVGDPRDKLALGATLADASLQHLLEPPSVTIVGLPNAGKSTLANALFGTRRSIVSAAAGTTRDWVGEPADLDGLIVTLIDTPGIRDTQDPIEERAIRASRRTIERADLVVLLLDGTRLDAEQRAIVAAYPGALRVLNKCDALRPAWDAERVRSSGAIPISAATGAGIDAIVDRVHHFFDIGRRPVQAARIWTARQRALIETMVSS